METAIPPYTWDFDTFNFRRDKFRNASQRPFDDIVQCMAMIDAYMQTASRRFADNVSQLICLIFLHGFAKGVRQSLVEQLGLVDPKDDVDFDQLVVEDEYIGNQRERLLAKRKCFVDSFNELDKFIS